MTQWQNELILVSEQNQNLYYLRVKSAPVKAARSHARLSC